MKKAIIVGATSGIGKALAIIMAEKGYQVGITGRRLENLNELKTNNPSAYEILAFDSTQESNGEKLLELTDRLGGLDILVMNSGIGIFNKQLAYDLEQQTIDLNVSAFTEVMDWGYNFFKKNGGGQLVAISSIAGIRGGRQAPAYNASKAYQSNYLEGLRQKAVHEKKSIIVTDIRPGFVDTPMAQAPNLFWVAPVEKAAGQIYGFIKNKSSVGYVTKRWSLIAMIMKVVPKWLYKRI